MIERVVGEMSEQNFGSSNLKFFLVGGLTVTITIGLSLQANPDFYKPVTGFLKQEIFPELETRENPHLSRLPHHCCKRALIKVVAMY